MVSDCYATFSKSIDFIEANLKEPITVTAIAGQVANYSLYHFVRLFRILTGETPGSYLKKRRLSEAAREIVDSNRSILDVAVAYQFGSHESFTRSFKKHFGVTPGELRRRLIFLHLTSRAMIVPVLLDPIITQTPHLDHQSNLLLAGLAYHGDNAHFELVDLWRSLMEQRHLLPNQRSLREAYGLWRYPNNFQVDRNFDYLAGVAMENLADLPPRFASADLKPCLYARFEHPGSLEHIRSTYIYIYGEWLPQSQYRLAGNYDLEFYDERFTGPDREDSVLNILVPVTTK
ncbi:transcriptional regulator containing an amidase domain and an AraC-type DNA-binding HTH domain [Longilinea arvoryzae]|uniref:Transcriptional regulator containing an amidase domain and an AraC-type DNA-binding HTH domain n=1 Tax=Longilinea arvoryzae TaxID=360412 RepID=A0A0S7BFW8_9CHLR|nr:GyrI-like domain-containing protein [Longilinea arvoryzae]GAP13382.1 transcriptional regulator containing an amidase domain and an AraC-type DNA-binding HTH domain [Longilinea arvoryzae]